MTPEPITGYTISEHARWEMSRRDVSEDHVKQVLTKPGQRQSVRQGRDVLQSRFKQADGRDYLIRVFIDVDRHPPQVVTAYRTSKVSKYWSEER